ncbi:hypothetical protein GCM10007989_35890 [Devosia pacifica]|uniref:DUF3329 domain-containing protein n=1 Tax=Devosia pacifica TaxID=1335967 RepID=A0A918VWS8_9HYPH|nr:DUF3329 domain-containing protein [Devosia pacifica]GHA36588.1 hypothetical protein GCM10007989_35890 [Devosia pacifica]
MKQDETRWLRPLWLRIILTAVIAVWCGWEWFGGEPLWGVLTAGMLAYAIYTLFIAFPKETPPDDTTRPPGPPER